MDSTPDRLKEQSSAIMLILVIQLKALLNNASVSQTRSHRSKDAQVKMELANVIREMSFTDLLR
jgi:hypothetical protein